VVVVFWLEGVVTSDGAAQTRPRRNKAFLRSHYEGG
jgi:hypothetical protein